MTKAKIDRLCKRCNTVKLITEFGSNNSKGSKKQAWCKLCSNEYFREWRKNNKDKSIKLEEKQFNTFYTTLHGRAVHMLNNAKRRAATKHVSIDLDVEWIEQKLMVGICEVTGLPLIIQENGGKGHKNNSFSPSIDRIRQDGPYSKDNCRITCWIYNRARGAFPPNDFETMLAALINIKQP